MSSKAAKESGGTVRSDEKVRRRMVNNTEHGKRPGREISVEKKNPGKMLRVVMTLVLSAGILTGCRLAREEAETQSQEEDRLVGLFVTEQYLDGGTPQVMMNSDGELSFAENRDRIDGRIVWDENGMREITFDGIEGFGIYDIKVWEEAQQGYVSYGIMDDNFSDAHWAVDSSDTSETNTVEAVIYVEQGGPACLYFNPVYQTVQGGLYLQPGAGLFSSGGVKGESMTHSVSWKRKTAENGQETAEESTFAISITYVDRTISYKLLLMDEDSEVTEVMTGEELAGMWAAGEWELRLPAGTAYLILEQEKSGGDIWRTVCNRGEESLEFLRSLGGGYMVKQQMNILWE